MYYLAVRVIILMYHRINVSLNPVSATLSLFSNVISDRNPNSISSLPLALLSEWFASGCLLPHPHHDFFRPHPLDACLIKDFRFVCVYLCFICYCNVVHGFSHLFAGTGGHQSKQLYFSRCIISFSTVSVKCCL